MDVTLAETKAIQKVKSTVLRSPTQKQQESLLLSSSPPVLQHSPSQARSAQTETVTAVASPTIATISTSACIGSFYQQLMIIDDENPDIVQNNVVTNLIAKNKRKNFSPRYTSINDESNDDETSQRTHPRSIDELNSPNSRFPSTMIPISVSSSDSNLKYFGAGNHNQFSNLINENSNYTTVTTQSAPITSMNWRRLLESQQNSIFPSSGPTAKLTSEPCPTPLIRNSPSDTFNNVDFKLLEMNAGSRNAVRAAAAVATCTTTTTTTSATSTLDGQLLKNEFACNAFNAVQELLNVYGLSISPSDIVDAFRKQQQHQQQSFYRPKTLGECAEPPTPPRTPISLATVVPTTGADEFDQQSTTILTRSPSATATMWSRNGDHESDTESSTPLITLASVSKLMGTTTATTTMTTTSSIMAGKFHQHSSSNDEIADDKENSTGNDECNVGEESAQKMLDDDCCDDDDSTTIASRHQHQRSNSQFSDRDDDSSSATTATNLCDMNRYFNDNDSNISSTIDDDRTSSDGTMQTSISLIGRNVAVLRSGRFVGDASGGGGGSSLGADDDGNDGFGVTQKGVVEAGGTGRVSVKNVENLFDKCSLNLVSPMLQLTQMQNDDKQLHAESMKHLTKFASYHDCKSETCQLENLREHYHCYDLQCLGKTLSKKEEIIRHLKWHKKRAESLNHGFLRFSSSDDCSLIFGTNCQHNRKQTHYHCFQPNCDKVYISTSDVQMHSNYHRKDSAIYQEGFQRFRATEECNAGHCMFAGQRTTHFHCRRDNCRYTFKNKADMEKHKSYHIKDLQLARDGFKKFLKTEVCPYGRCRFSRICNHIHCVRENCHYVLHSSGQLLSHKRKHERMDSEQAYRRFRMAQKAAAVAAAAATMIGDAAKSQLSANAGGSSTNPGGSTSKPSTPPSSSPAAISPDLQIIPGEFTTAESFAAAAAVAAAAGCGQTPSIGRLPGTTVSQSTHYSPVDLSLFYAGNAAGGVNLPHNILQQIRQQHLFRLPAKNDEQSSGQPGSLVPPLGGSLSHILNSSSADDVEQLIRQYFSDNCTRQQFTATDGGGESYSMGSDQTEPLNLKSSIRNSFATESSSTIQCFMTPSDPPHLHCLVKNCEAVVPRNILDISEHMRMHEISRNAESFIQNSNLLQITSIEGFFNRKRGRPPKNRVIEVYNNPQHQSPQAIFTSFKLEKTLSDPQMIPPLSHSLGYNSKSSELLATRVAASRGATTTTPPPPSSSISSIASERSHKAADQTVALHEAKFQISQDGEKCTAFPSHLPSGTDCIFSQQWHFHCSMSDRCHFATSNPATMERHMAENHGEDFNHFTERDECCVFGCVHSQETSHYHCKRCGQGAMTRLEIEEHLKADICNFSANVERNSTLQYESRRECDDDVLNSLLSNKSNNNNNNNNNDVNERVTKISSFEDHDAFVPADKQHATSSPVQPSLTRRNDSLNVISGGDKSSASESQLDCSGSTASSTAIKFEPTVGGDDEKVSGNVVRAAGTYFPQNSNNSSDTETSPSSSSNRRGSTPPLSDLAAGSMVTATTCQRSFCKLKRKSHQHCNLCNQAFSDKTKLEIHRLKHATKRLGVDSNDPISLENDSDCLQIKNEPKIDIDQSSHAQNPNQQLDPSPSVPVASSLSSLLGFSPAMAAAACVSSGLQNFTDNFSIQNFHFAHLAALYQQNPFYYQSFYPFFNSRPNLPNAAAMAAATGHSELLQAQLAAAAAASTTSANDPNSPATVTMKTSSGGDITESLGFHAARTQPATSTVSGAQTSALESVAMPSPPSPAAQFELSKLSHDILSSLTAAATASELAAVVGGGRRKRKLDEFGPTTTTSTSIASGSAATSGLMEMNAAAKKLFKTNKQGNFKIFKDEPIPQGYLKFRFNEDCNFPNCGYRNHQSHFHCCRKDCYYSFCDKTRFVQHTARHERLDKLMGDDFKQYRANMRCGYEDCVYSKNLAGQSNKSSHFHCLKCNFICSDTNKVVAHRRQHSKMEFIRMAGFRKVANNEKCMTRAVIQSTTSEEHGLGGDAAGTSGNAAMTAAATSSGCGSSEGTSNGAGNMNECTYSLKQTHYHCLVCDCSVLSRAQLGSHRHRVQ